MEKELEKIIIESILDDIEKSQKNKKPSAVTHADVCKKLNDIYTKKNKDYGDSANDTFNKFGMTAYLVRMSDKLNRLISLNNSKEINYESIDDTLLDLANYSIMAYLSLKNKK